MLISVLIIDDDEGARNILKGFLSTDDRVFIIDDLENTKGALELIEFEEPDVVFLDINMPVEDGLEFATRLNCSSVQTKVIFTTAYHMYAYQAFGLKPFYYLTKPFGLIDIHNLIDKIVEMIDFEEKKLLDYARSEMSIQGKLKLETKNGYLFVDPKEIVFFDSVANHCEYMNTNGEFVILYEKLKDIEPFLKYFNFIRLNRTRLANIQYVRRVDKKIKVCFSFFGGVEYETHLSRSSLKKLECMDTIKLG